MQIILKDDISGLGFKNDMVKVKPGYARNYLIPNGLAVVANRANIKRMEEDQRQVAHKQEKLIGDADVIKTAIEKLKLSFSAKVNDSGRIFGSISPSQVADGLKDKGYAIDRRRVRIPSAVKELGEYVAHIALHREVTAEVPFEVVEEKE